jgi:hypothetical protein
MSAFSKVELEFPILFEKKDAAIGPGITWRPAGALQLSVIPLGAPLA